MSRSRKKMPVTGITCAESDKPFKVAEHRRERRHVAVQLHVNPDDAAPRLHPAPFGNPWAAPKDGKQIWTKNQDKARRK